MPKHASDWKISAPSLEALDLIQECSNRREAKLLLSLNGYALYERGKKTAVYLHPHWCCTLYGCTVHFEVKRTTPFGSLRVIREMTMKSSYVHYKNIAPMLRRIYAQVRAG